ncbi:MAG: MFS transporter [Candidatus Gastranaerophilales bacterium]|nr:MFS transporter [Candidatus Gastranaerophilales bacterium]
MSNEAVEKENSLKPFSTIQLLNFCLGFFGLQFAWQMRIILSGPVTEGLGASPLLFGLIWLAGPVTGMVVQPIIGELSDKTNTIFGKRRPYLFAGALFASLALWAFPNSAAIAENTANILHKQLPVYGGLIIAAIMIWIIDACVNAAQGPYRALVPDLVPPEQHSLANSYLSFAIGLGSVVAAGTAPFLKYVCNYQMSINAQFIMAALAFSLAMLWTCITIKEHNSKKIDIVPAADNVNQETEKISFLQKITDFFKSSPEVGKICTLQFFTWIGIMSLNIFFTQYAIHTVYGIPDLTTASEEMKASYLPLMNKATNFSSICFAIQNLICFLVSIPIGILSTKFGNKKIHFAALLTLALTFIGMGIYKEPKFVLICMAIAGIGWASILALPFAMLSEFIKKGSEGSVMGIFNIFIAGPQVLVCTVLAWIVSKCSYNVQQGINYHWEYAFYIGAATLAAAAVITNLIKEKQ